MNDIAHCTGLLWKPVGHADVAPRQYTEPCPRRNECHRHSLHFHLLDRVKSPEALDQVNYINGPQAGTNCELFIST
jgi:hypothetical protein